MAVTSALGDAQSTLHNAELAADAVVANCK